jgi:hypothetical protein
MSVSGTKVNELPVDVERRCTCSIDAGVFHFQTGESLSATAAGMAHHE